MYPKKYISPTPSSLFYIFHLWHSSNLKKIVVYINISWEQLDRYSSDYYLAKDEEYKTVMEVCGAMEIIIWPLMKTSISNIQCVTKVVDSSLSTGPPWIFSKYVLCYYAYFLAFWRPIFKYVIWLWKKLS